MLVPKRIILLFFVFISINIDGVTSRGGRGGGGSRGGGFRGGSRSSYGSRGSSVRYSYRGYRSSYYTSLSGSWFVMGYAAGSYSRVYGLHYYQRRHLYSSTAAPTVCLNHKDGCLKIVTANTTSFTTASNLCYDEFICPLSTDKDDADYCCGDPDNGGQYCCNFWGSSGRTAGAVIGFICLAALCIGLPVYCLVRHKKCAGCNRSRQETTPTIEMRNDPIPQPYLSPKYAEAMPVPSNYIPDQPPSYSEYSARPELQPALPASGWTK